MGCVPALLQAASLALAYASHSPMQGFATKAVHGTQALKDELGSVIMPIYQTSTFRFKSAEHGAACFAGEVDDFIYTRINNPTVRELEQTLAILEEGAETICTSSGMAAVNVVFFGLLSKGSHVICHETCYGPSRSVLEAHYARFGVEASFVDTCDVAAVEAAVKPNTVLLYLETPSNPTVSVADLPALSQVAKLHNLTLCVDNTFLGPALQTPLTFGADIVLHSMTKSINGHADVVAGCIVTQTKEMAARLRPIMITMGMCLDANSAFLTRRGLKTLPLRVERAQDSAMRLALYLESHAKVAWVRYPGLESHPQHEVAKRIMKGPGSMISFGLKGGLDAGKKLLNSVKLCALAVSLGGVETLIQHPASMTHAKLSPQARLKAGVSDDLIRLSVGIEETEAVMADLAQALESVDAGDAT